MKSPRPDARRQKTLALSLVLIALAFLAYWPALRGGFIWDDDDYVTDNPALLSAQGLWDIWAHPTASPQYYPMVFTTFWVEHHLWGNHPAGYHIDNVLLHAISCILLWRILSWLQVPGCFLAACVFAVHPLMVESVAWITERKNVLSGVFYFAAGMVYLKSRVSGFGFGASGEMTGDRMPETRDPNLLLALLLFLLALLSKSVTCSWPAAILPILWWKRGRIARREVVRLIPFFIIGLAFAMNTALFERTHVQAVGSEWNYSPAARILIASRAVWFYATKVVLPFHLSFVYPKWPINPRLAWQWAFVIGVIVALAVLWAMQRRWGRGPLAAALFFIGTLFPALGFFNIYPMRYTFVADHYAYLAAAGLFVPLAIGFHRVLCGLGRPLMIAIVILPLLMLSMLRAGVYRSADALWRDTLAKNPNSWMVELNLAKTLVAEGRFAEAIPHFARQLELAPNLPETHWNYAGCLYDQGKLDDAIAQYTEAIRLGGQHPLPQALFGRGRVYLKQNKLAQAAADFARAIDLKPDYAQAHNELGTTLKQQKHYAAALQQYEIAVTIDPSLAEARVNLAALLAAAGQIEQATAQFNAAVTINPSLEKYREKVLNAR